MALSEKLDGDSASERLPRRRGFCWSELIFLLPLGLCLSIVLFSPNFQWRENQPDGKPPFRENPYGGDYLQDWIGGLIASSQPSERALLYKSEYPIQLQHSPTVIGFAWPEEKYFPMVYPPYHYVLVSPLSQIPYRWATIAWTILSGLLYCLIGWLLVHHEPTLRNRPLMLLLGMTIFAPAILCLNGGQKSIWLLFFMVATYLLMRRGKPFRAGLIFGLVAIKPQFGLVIGLVMLLKNQLRFVLGALTTVVVLCQLSHCLQPSWLRDYSSVVLGMRDYVSTVGYQLQDAHSLWGGLKFMLSASAQGLFSYLLIVAYGLVVGLTIWGIGVRKPLNPASDKFAFQFSILILATILISPHLYTYDLTVLMLPLGLIIPRLIGQLDPVKNATPLSAETGRASFGVAARWTLSLAVVTFAIAGFLPGLNYSTSVAWGVLIILAWLTATCAYTSRLI